MSGEFGVRSPSAVFDELFGELKHLPLPTGVDKVDSWRKLNAFGQPRILEMISKGMLGPEIAAAVGVPMVHFQSWLTEMVDPMELARARQAAAEAFVVKSILPLTVTYDSPGHAALAKALSERMAWVAQRLDPNRWGDVKPSTKDTAPVKFVFNMGEAKMAVEAKPAAVTEQRDISSTLKLLQTDDYVVVEDE